MSALTGGSTIDVAAARAATPGVEHVIHLNNAGASLAPQPVLDAMIGHLEFEAVRGAYEAAAEVEERTEAVYSSVAQLLNAAPDEIALVDSATRAWDAVFYAFAATLRPGERIVTGRAEYASNVIAFLQTARRCGVLIDVIEDDASGATDVSALAARLDSHVRLVCVTHVPTSGGLVNPVAEIGKVTQAAGIPYLVDACQSAGQLPLDVDAIGCDALSATGRKFLRGPRGTGFLYVKRDRITELEPPVLDLHSATWTAADQYEIRTDARRFETWENSAAARLGLGAAVDHALGWGLEAIAARVGGLAARLREGLRVIDRVQVHDRGGRLCGIVTFTVDGYDAADVIADLTRARINTAVSTAESAQLDLGARGLSAVVRASVHYFNTDVELEALLTRVDALPRR